MAQWRIKEISDLTKISVRMLHHYDKVGLLKPSTRASNGYRWYSERDLAKLQQIIALKFFGFSLEQIKTMLHKAVNVQDHLRSQQQMLKEQAEHFRQASDILAAALNRCVESDSLDKNDLITLIDRYRMMEELKKTWVGKLTEQQQENYVKMKQAYPQEFAAWDALINNTQLGDPEGPEGEQAIKIFTEYMKACHTWNQAQQINPKTIQQDAADAFDLGQKLGTKEITPMSQEFSLWFAKAQIAHRWRLWENLHEEIRKNLDTAPESEAGKKLATQWRDVVSAHFPAQSPQDFQIGQMLIGQDLQQKIALQGPKAPGEAQSMVMETMKKMLGDPMATIWIEKALRTH